MNRVQQAAANARLAELESRHDGNLTPTEVLEDARDPLSPLHSHFEWNDGKAAEAWRIEQARSLIRSVRVTITIESRSVSVVGYARNPDLPGNEQGYVSVARLIDDRDRAREVLTNEFDRVSSALRRARELSIAFGLANDIDILSHGVEVVRRRLPPEDRTPPSMQ